MKSNNYWPQFFKAAEVGDFEKCQVILDKIEDKNQKDKWKSNQPIKQLKMYYNGKLSSNYKFFFYMVVSLIWLYQIKLKFDTLTILNCSLDSLQKFSHAQENRLPENTCML